MPLVAIDDRARIARHVVSGGGSAAAAMPTAARNMAKPDAARIEHSSNGGKQWRACFTRRPLLGKRPIPEFART